MNERLKHIFHILTPPIKNTILSHNCKVIDTLEEIRLRINRNIFLVFNGGDVELEGYIVTRRDIDEIFSNLMNNSVYAHMEEIKNSFITITGGHRVGISGRAVLNGDKVENIKDITSLSIRVAKELIGISTNVVREIVKDGFVLNTLIISPPNCGKTTLLRDITRELSDLKFKVSVIDERGELAAVSRGVPYNDIGKRTDVFTAVPKVAGIIMAIRSMSPDVIITDELGKKEDFEAVITAVNSGVSVVATMHAYDISDILKRNEISKYLENGTFKKIITLGKNDKFDRVEKIQDGKDYVF